MENKEIITQMLNEIYQKSVEKKIQWQVLNPSAFRWIKSNEPPGQTISTLQKQSPPNPGMKENYVLTIQPPNGQTIQISSSNEPSYKDILMNIFIEATKEAARIEEEKKIETIKNLLKGI